MLTNDKIPKREAKYRLKKEDHASRSMLFSQVIDKNRNLLPNKVEKVMRDIIEELANHLASGNDISLRQLGTWRTKNRKAKKARNPRTGEIVSVGERIKIHYRPSRHIFCLLNPNIKKSTDNKKSIKKITL
ncbi:MAG: HU family DNA-binding protein [Alphaproteobacteria bacterium]